MHLACYSVCTSLPIGDNILETNKQPSNHVQFIDSGADDILTCPINIESMSVGNN